MRVLIVDDNPALRSVLRRSLERGGTHEVVGEGMTGRDAISLAASLHPDVIILDVMMPEMTGVEALAVLRLEQPEVRVIMYSSMVRPGDENRAYPPGALAWIAKAASMGELWAALARVG